MEFEVAGILRGSYTVEHGLQLWTFMNMVYIYSRFEVTNGTEESVMDEMVEAEERSI